jgi:integrase
MAGITKHHASTCGTRRGSRCDCTPGFQAWVWSPRDRKKLYRTLPSHAAARSWRAQASNEVKRGSLRAADDTTLREAAKAWLTGAREGTIRNRSGDRYKPSVLRGYEQSLRLYVLRDLGAHRLAQITTSDLQALVDRLHAANRKPATIRNALLPLRAIYRRACARDGLPVNPTAKLELPAVRGRRDRVASPREAARLIDALPEQDRAVWATAFYAGLRLGELQALRTDHVDVRAGVIRVEASWDPHAGPVEPKSRAGRRSVPIAQTLRAHLARHQLAADTADGFVFGRSAEMPFAPSALHQRARKAWADAGLTPITLHEARHTFASLMIAAGVNAKALSTYMGHAGVAITFDRYGHLMPGNEAEAAGLLDAYLGRWTVDPERAVEFSA